MKSVVNDWRETTNRGIFGILRMTLMFYGRKCFLKVSDDLYPTVKCKVWKDRAEWVDGEVMRAINKKRNYVCKQLEVDDVDWQKYKLVRTEVAGLLRHTKRQYIVSTLKSKKGDPKGFWKEIGFFFLISPPDSKAFNFQ